MAAGLGHLWEQGGPALPPAWGHSCCTGGSVWGTFSPPCSHPSDGAEPGDGAGGCCPVRVLPVPLSGFYSLTGSGVAAWDLLSSSHHTPAHPGELGWDIPARPQREQAVEPLSGLLTPRDDHQLSS